MKKNNKTIIVRDNHFKVSPYEINFPGGEKVIGLDEEAFFYLEKGGTPKDFLITSSVESSQDLFELALICNILRAKYGGGIKIELNAPYIFGGRQDRPCNKGESLNAKVVAEHINNLNFNKVFTFCPHSDVLPALINNCEVLNFEDGFIIEAFKRIKKDSLEDFWVCSPDAGAQKRTLKAIEALQKKYSKVRYLQGEKVRDVKTGKLTGFSVDQDHLEGLPVMVLDDVCANGGTFLGLSDVLKTRGSGLHYMILGHADHMEGLRKLVDHGYHKVIVGNTRAAIKSDENLGIIAI